MTCLWPKLTKKIFYENFCLKSKILRNFYATKIWNGYYMHALTSKEHGTAFSSCKHLLKNDLAVKMVWPCSKWLVWKNLWNQKGQPRNGCDGIGTLMANLCCLIPASPQNSAELLSLNFLPLTYTITAISWLPLWFHNFFHTGHFEQGCTFLNSQAVFE